MKKLTGAAAALALLACGAGRARAGVVIDINQVGGNVVVTGSGTIDLTDLIFAVSVSSQLAGIQPSVAAVIQGPPSGASVDAYLGLTGPSSFGPGGVTFPPSGSGDVFGFAGFAGQIVVPRFYASGASLSGADTYPNATFSSLGLTPGTYTYTWGTGAHADSLTVQIGPAPAVPEPSSLALLGAGGLALLGYGWRRRAAAVA